MADKRMFSRTIIDSDIFLDMPVSAQNLYFHLNLRADDEGFIDSPRKIMRAVSASNDDLKLLLAKRYLLSFESGVIVIKHWKLHNTIRRDRLKETLYIEEKSQLYEKENGAYTDCQPSDNQVTTNCQHRLDKVSIEEYSIEEEKPRKRFTAPTVEDIKEYAKSLGYTGFNAVKFHAHYESIGWKVGRNKMKSWRSSVVSWHSNDFNTKASQPNLEEYHKRATARGRCKVCDKFADLKYGKCEECI